MIKKILAIGLLVLFLCMGTVCATEVTMEVDSKHIIGMGSGNTPFDIGEFINVVYVISEIDETKGYYLTLQEYPISIEDYNNIHVGDKVVLDVPDSRTMPCKVVKIN